MTKPDARWHDLVDLLARVRAGWPASTWLWDERFECALSTLTKDSWDKARDAAAAVLPTTWSTASLAGAPQLVRDLCAETGGLRSDQVLFTGDAGNGVFAYCLFWPWDNRSNYSARVGALGVGRLSDLEAIVRYALAIK